MGDPLSIASGVIGILTLALNASKKLYELSQSIQGHPREVESMRDEFKMLSSILKQLQQKSTKALSSKDELLEAPLKGCFDCCDELNKSLKGLGSPGVRDWLRLQFRGRAIEDLKARLLSYKSYLSIALQVIELEESSATRDNVNKLKEQLISIKKDLEYDLRVVNGDLVGVQKSLKEVLEKERRSLEANVAACQAAETALERHRNVDLTFTNNTANTNSRQLLGTDNLDVEGRITATGNRAEASSTQGIGMYSAETLRHLLRRSTSPSTRDGRTTVTADAIHIQGLSIRGGSTSLSALTGVSGEDDHDGVNVPLPTASHRRQD
ncbi:hypothetical protein D6C85_03713 [Aureobasidium pullulans]|uniref:Azaphilone pigments biosynthesis cluster protein L N-terminal domain-containing protein n=1 Tax=Aureobasidium pullulans TaxID=5580 RepID=A0A4S9X806_AURPU|nr:hypothetical protein D6C85_03713 [Aureobasidium pullulans]